MEKKINKKIKSTREKPRLNVYIAHAGLCSRRKADELIAQGEITVNHGVIRHAGYQVQDKDTVRYKKKVIKPGIVETITLALNKPIGVITAAADDKHRATVMDLLDKKFKTRVYPIGRLDLNTSGLLLLTNDGELAHKLAHPKFNVQKVYQVTLNADLSDTHLERIKKGIRLTDGPIKVDHIHRGLQKYKAKVTVHSGRFRIVRRIFESLGYTVKKLDRINFAGITKRNLAEGEYRVLTAQEVAMLNKKMIEST